jgi:hypothetical protein
VARKGAYLVLLRRRRFCPRNRALLRAVALLPALGRMRGLSLEVARVRASTRALVRARTLLRGLMHPCALLLTRALRRLRAVMRALMRRGALMRAFMRVGALMRALIRVGALMRALMRVGALIPEALDLLSSTRQAGWPPDLTSAPLRQASPQATNIVRLWQTVAFNSKH